MPLNNIPRFLVEVRDDKLAVASFGPRLGMEKEFANRNESDKGEGKVLGC